MALSLSFLSDLNQRPTDYKSVALPTELRKLIGRVFSKTLSVHVPPPLDSFLRSQPLQVHLLRIFIHPGVQYRVEGGSVLGSHQHSFRRHFWITSAVTPLGRLDSVPKYITISLYFQGLCQFVNLLYEKFHQLLYLNQL